MFGVVVGIYLFEYSQNMVKLEDKARISDMLSVELSDIYNELSNEKFTIIGSKQILSTVARE